MPADTLIQSAGIQDRIAKVLALHFDPKWGTPYWLDRAQTLGFDPRDEIQTVSDFHRLGPMRPVELLHRPLSDFIPLSLVDQQRGLIVAQSGGTSGRPVWTAYRADEFEEAFVKPFLVAAQHVGFPKGEPWLYVGPSGPHIIARAAEAIAVRTGSASPYTVDFDASWARKLPVNSFAAKRYLNHIVEQALYVIRHQPVAILFATPPVLAALAQQLSLSERQRLLGVHYGGMALDCEQLAEFQNELFPNAVHLSGYGNTLFGCCLELFVQPGRELHYFPYGNRILFGHVDEETRLVQYGAAATRSRIVFSRLDSTMLLVNVLERDEAAIVTPPSDAPAGFEMPGVASPLPLRQEQIPVQNSIY